MWRGGICPTVVKTGIIHIGYHEADAVDTYSSHTIIDVHKDGRVECHGDVHIGHGAVLCVKKGGVLTLGRNFAISGTTKIVCSGNITFGDNVQTSWDTLIMDSDAHRVFAEDGTSYPNQADIFIGDNVWIAANVTVLKGTQVPAGCIVSGFSFLNKTYTSPNCIIGGIPAKEIKKIGGWEI